MGKIDDLFAMKWVLPEHAATLSDHYYEQSLEVKPHIDEDDLAAMSAVIYDSRKNDFAVKVTWFEAERGNLGRTYSEWGIVQINMQTRQIKLARDDGIWFISIDNLVTVEPVELRIE